MFNPVDIILSYFMPVFQVYGISSGTGEENAASHPRSSPERVLRKIIRSSTERIRVLRPCRLFYPALQAGGNEGEDKKSARESPGDPGVVRKNLPWTCAVWGGYRMHGRNRILCPEKKQQDQTPHITPGTTPGS